MKKILSFLLLVIGCWSCNNVHKEMLSATAKTMITAACPTNDREMIIYYFDGECSFCIAKMAATEKKYADNQQVSCVFIARTSDQDLLKYSAKELKIKSCLIIEQSEAYKSYLTYGAVTRVGKNGEIISRVSD